MAGNSADTGRTVTSKIVAILQTFTDGSAHSLTEVAHLTGLPVSTVHRLATELTSWGVLDRGDEGRYRPGLPLTAIGRTATYSASWQDIARHAIEDLAAVTSTTVRLGVLDDGEVRFIEKTSATRAATVFSPRATLPVHATAVGKVLLAFAPPATLDRVLGGDLPRFTMHTPSRDRLRRGLAEVRAAHLAISRWEHVPGQSGIAVPVFAAGGVVAGLEILVRNLRADLARFQPALCVAARSLSRELIAARVAPDSTGAPTADHHRPGVGRITGRRFPPHRPSASKPSLNGLTGAGREGAFPDGPSTVPGPVP